MAILEIDSVPYGSTCKIMVGISKVANHEGLQVITGSGYSSHPIKELPAGHIKVGGFLNKAVHIVFSRLTGLDGYCSVIATIRLLAFMKRNHVDIIHFHNIHGAYLNLPILFGYIKKKHIRVIWTFHDCWNFTGLCPYFTMAKCEKWKNGCSHCPQYKKTFSGYLVDQSEHMWKKKKEWFTGLEQSVIVTPSKWLARLVKESFLKEYPVVVINNGIDVDVFSPRLNCREKLNLPQDRFILLGVAMGWGKRKGLDVFVRLAEKLDGRFLIILVGTNDQIDKEIPSSILSVHRTQNQSELAEYYSAANVLINPTREENFPTVNLEALACGTPVITFDTGGSPEMLDENCGAVVPCDDISALAGRIIQECENPSFDREYCRKKALCYNMNDRFREYVELYKKYE